MQRPRDASPDSREGDVPNSVWRDPARLPFWQREQPTGLAYSSGNVPSLELLPERRERSFPRYPVRSLPRAGVDQSSPIRQVWYSRKRDYSENQSAGWVSESAGWLESGDVKGQHSLDQPSY